MPQRLILSRSFAFFCAFSIILFAWSRLGLWDSADRAVAIATQDDESGTYTVDFTANLQGLSGAQSNITFDFVAGTATLTDTLLTGTVTSDAITPTLFEHWREIEITTGAQENEADIQARLLDCADVPLAPFDVFRPLTNNRLSVEILPSSVTCVKVQLELQQTGATNPIVSQIDTHWQIPCSAGSLLVGSGSGNTGEEFDPLSGSSLGTFFSGGGIDFARDVKYGTDGNLYVSSTNNSQVLRYDGDTGAFIGVFASGGGIVSPRGIAFGPDGNLYVASPFDNSVYRYDGETGAFIDIFVPNFSGGLIFPGNGLEFGPDGNLYVLSNGNTVLRYNGDTGAFIDSFATNGGISGGVDIVFGADDNLYLSFEGAGGGIMRFNGSTGAFIDQAVSGQTVRGMTRGDDGFVYFVSSDQVFRLDIGTDTVTTMSTAGDQLSDAQGIIVRNTNTCFDFGDSESTYPVTRNDDGARHIFTPALFLGTTVDAENDGNPSPLGTGDNNTGTSDESGVSFPTLTQGGSPDLSVRVSGTGVLNAWIDFNANGDWNDAGEQIATDLAVSDGINTVAIAIPSNAVADTALGARFRVDTTGGLSPTGLAIGGEVEDYMVQIGQACSASQTGGMAFRDTNGNGTLDSFESGVAAVTVTAYDDTNAAVSTATTTKNGSYILSGLTDGEDYRIELTNSPSFLQAGVLGTNSESTVTFITAPICDVDIAFSNPGQHCQDSPNLATSCYIVGEQIGESADVVVSFAFTAGNDGTSTDIADYQDPHLLEATADQAGTTFGLTYQSASNSLFASAYMKRHSGFGASGTGAIYRIDRGTGTVSTFVDLNTLLGSSVAGSDPHPTGTDFNVDAASWDAVGKIALGGMDLSDDEKTLYVMNLNDRQLYEFPIGIPPVAPLAGDISTYAIPTPATCIASDVRPFAVKTHDAMVYIGMICSAETSQSVSDLRGYVYSFDPSDSSFTQILDFALDYPRGCANDGNIDECDDPTATPGSTPDIYYQPADWFPWRSSFGGFFKGPSSSFNIGSYPQPIFTDIAFDQDDNIIIGLRDRFGDQTGTRQFDTAGSGTEYTGVSAGDVLRACQQIDGTWQMESNGACGNYTVAGRDNDQGIGGGEYYDSDAFSLSFLTVHDEIGLGGLEYVPNSGTVAMTVFDPAAGTDTSSANVYSAGVHWYENQAAELTQAHAVYTNAGALFPPPAAPNFGKANGLGDLEALCETPPLEIGNRIWDDVDRDGIQDAGESGIGGVTLRLYDMDNAGALIATTLSDPQGIYSFDQTDGLMPNTNYEIRVDNATDFTTGQPLSNFVLTQANQGTDLHDSDAQTLASTDPGIALQTGDWGENDHTFDLGFRSLPVIGDTIWGDVDGDGIFEPSDGEVGIAGLEVLLYEDVDLDRIAEPNGDDGASIDSDTTDALGRYEFEGLADGNYFVEFELPAGFIFTDALVSTTNTALDSDAEIDTGLTRVVILSGGTNIRTLDAGIYEPGSIAGTIWNDLNRDDVFDIGTEPGIDNVTITIFRDDEDGIFEPTGDDALITDTVTTTGGGAYLFSEVRAGDYWVQISDNNAVLSEFAHTGGTLPELISLAASEDRTDTDFGFEQQVDLSLSLTIDDETPAVNQQVELSLTLTNQSSGTGENIEVTDTLASFDTIFQYISDDSGGDYDPLTGIWSITSLPGGNQANITITGRVISVGTFSVNAEITASNQSDPDSTSANDDGDQSEDDEQILSIIVSQANTSSRTSTSERTTSSGGSTRSILRSIRNSREQCTPPLIASTPASFSVISPEPDTTYTISDLPSQISFPVENIFATTTTSVMVDQQLLTSTKEQSEDGHYLVTAPIPTSLVAKWTEQLNSQDSSQSQSSEPQPLKINVLLTAEKTELCEREYEYSFFLTLPTPDPIPLPTSNQLSREPDDYLRTLILPETGYVSPRLSDAYGGDSLFSDLSINDPYYEPTVNLVLQGIIKGEKGSEMNIDRPITRAEFSKIMIHAAEQSIPADSVSRYRDVRSGQWFLPYLHFLIDQELMEVEKRGNFTFYGAKRSVTLSQTINTLFYLFEISPQEESLTPDSSSQI